MNSTPPLSTAVADLPKSIATNHDAMIILTQSYPADAVIRVVDAHTKREVSAALARSAAPAPALADGELLPCPFCGSGDVGGGSGIVHCYRCKVATPACTSTAGAVAIWNRRAAPASDIAAAPEQPLWDDNGEPWNEAAEKVERDRLNVAPPTRGTESQHEAIAGAVARGWCAPANENKVMDEELAYAIIAEIEKLLSSRFRAQGGNTNNNSLAAPGSATAGAAKNIDHDAFWVLVARCRDAKPGADYRGHSENLVRYVNEWAKSRAPAEVSPPDGAMPEKALRKLCDQLDGMKRRLRPTPGTGQHHSYLMHEDVEAYVEEARKALAAQPAEGSAQVAKADDAVWASVMPYQSCAICGYPETKHACSCSPKVAAPERSDTPAPDVCAEMRALCSACGGTGEVHDITGEWRGSCDCAASQALDAAPAGNWISVDERLPEIETDVLVRGKRGDSICHEVAGLFGGEWLGQNSEQELRFIVHHWMPLPRIDGDKQGAPDAPRKKFPISTAPSDRVIDLWDGERAHAGYSWNRGYSEWQKEGAPSLKFPSHWMEPVGAPDAGGAQP